jgi:hypothetical protein
MIGLVFSGLATISLIMSLNLRNPLLVIRPQCSFSDHLLLDGPDLNPPKDYAFSDGHSNDICI